LADIVIQPQSGAMELNILGDLLQAILSSYRGRVVFGIALLTLIALGCIGNLIEAAQQAHP
jgi:hypothetical protein